MTTFTRDVPVEHLAKVLKRVKAAQAKAGRLGVPVPTVSVGEHRLVPDPRWQDGSDDWADKAPKIIAAPVTVEAPEHLGLPGYTLLARVDRLPDGSPLVVRTPGTEGIPLPAIESAGYCDHCRAVRRRRETFLVHGPDGTHQVGRQCLRDFLGADPEALLWWSSWTRSLVEGYEEAWGSASDLYYLTDSVLLLASRVAARAGYLSASKREALFGRRQAGDPPPPDTTKAIVLDWFSPPTSRRDREALDKIEAKFPLDEDAQRLYEATRGALDVLQPNGNEWLQNVALVTSQDEIDPKHLGIAVSAVLLGLRAIEDSQPKPEAPEIVSRPLGAVGERLRALPVTVTFIRHFDSEWGTRTLIKVRAEEAEADLLWWASGYLSDDIVGQQRALTGTVKAHETDKYTRRPVTVVTRASLEEAS